ncbi:MAG TPA: lysozyme inhibitor LprI family protein [Xanthobacteraceae bacterium]|nr:lysozyme inhibitor LprI family protein [Xanthobacteraceae bacterium]
MIQRIVLIAVLALAALAGAMPGQAQNRKPTAAEIKLIRDCAEAHREDGEGEQKCAFNLVADPCGEKNDSNLGRADCFRIETVIWDALLNDNYKELMDAIDDKNDQDKLKEMQRAWIAYRDTTCNFYWYKIHGSMSVPMTAACQLRETARRALLLAFFVRL